MSHNASRPTIRRFQPLPPRTAEQFQQPSRNPFGRTWVYRIHDLQPATTETRIGPWIPRGSYIKHAQFIINTLDRDVFTKLVLLQQGETPDVRSLDLLAATYDNFRGAPMSSLTYHFQVGRTITEPGQIGVVVTSISASMRWLAGSVTIQGPQPVTNVPQ